MNTSITRVAIFALLLLTAVVAATTYWQTWAVGGLNERQDNAIQRVAQLTVKRGRIFAADGTLMATNVEKKVGDRTLYLRTYPTGRLLSNVVGYSTQAHSRTGLERSENDYLTAANSGINTLVDRLAGATVTGNDLHLTVQPNAEYLAEQALAGRCGSVVALDPRTGKVLVMATSPGYNPNQVEQDYAVIARTKAACEPPAPLLNRGTSGLFTPGSTFKVITMAAALDSGAYGPESHFTDPGYCIEYGKKVSNYSDQNGPEKFGLVTLTDALVHSINAVFCEIGKTLGPKTILSYAKRFGFYSTPPLETPVSERAPSGLYNGSKLFQPKDASEVDPGRMAFGQERMLVTPLQMAMVMGAVANGGIVMKPYVVDHVTAPDGTLVAATRREELGPAIKPETAGLLSDMLEQAVTRGTGGNAAIPGVRVAGKTGTAETGTPGINTTWFVAFAPVDNPRIAVAVVLENQRGTGGATAAPIAKTIMQALLRSTANS